MDDEKNYQEAIHCEDDGEYKTWIHTNIWEFIPEYTFNYLSIYTTMIVHLYEYL